MNEQENDNNNTMKSENDREAREFEAILDDPKLTAYALGELSAAVGDADVAAEIALFEEQIAADPAVRASVEAVRATAGVLVNELQAEGGAILSSTDKAALADFALSAGSGGGDEAAEVAAGVAAVVLPFPVSLVRARWFKLSAGLAAVVVVTVSASLVWQLQRGGGGLAESNRLASSEVGMERDAVAAEELENNQGAGVGGPVASGRLAGSARREDGGPSMPAETTLEHASKKIAGGGGGGGWGCRRV